MKLEDACSLKGRSKPRQHIKKQRHHFANKGLCSQNYGLSGSHVRMWELDHDEDWALKNWCFWTVLEITLESPLTARRSNPSILWDWPPDAKNWLTGKTLMLGKIESKTRRGWQKMSTRFSTLPSYCLPFTHLGSWRILSRSWHVSRIQQCLPLHITI